MRAVGWARICVSQLSAPASVSGAPARGSGKRDIMNKRPNNNLHDDISKGNIPSFRGRLPPQIFRVLMSITEPLLHVVVDRERDGRADGVLHEVERDALEEAQEPSTLYIEATAARTPNLPIGDAAPNACCRRRTVSNG